jgi:hypothetical protein
LGQVGSAGPTLAAAASPLCGTLGCLGGGVGAPPPNYIKGAPGDEENTQQQATCLLSSSFCAALSTSTSLSRAWPPEGLRRIEIIPPLHAIVLRSFWIRSKVVYFHNLGWIRDSGVIVITVRLRVCGGAALVAPESLHRVLQRP